MIDLELNKSKKVVVLRRKEFEEIKNKAGFTAQKMHDVFRWNGDVYWFSGIHYDSRSKVGTLDGRRYIVNNSIVLVLLWIVLFPLRWRTGSNLDQNLFVKWKLV